jgi:cell cycle checkpoint control protein RAD9A
MVSVDLILRMFLQSLLSILRHRTVEKTVERCEMSIVEGVAPTEDETLDEDQDGLESKLIVRLHCKHGDQMCSIYLPASTLT